MNPFSRTLDLIGLLCLCFDEQAPFTQSASRMSRQFVTDAYRDGKRFIVRADETLTAFLELESAIRRATAEISFSRNPA